MDELDKSMSYLEFPRRHSGKETACQCKRHSFDPWVGKIPGGGNGNPLQYPCLGNPMDRGAWWPGFILSAYNKSLIK